MQQGRSLCSILKTSRHCRLRREGLVLNASGALPRQWQSRCSAFLFRGRGEFCGAIGKMDGGVDGQAGGSINDCTSSSLLSD